MIVNNFQSRKWLIHAMQTSFRSPQQFAFGKFFLILRVKLSSTKPTIFLYHGSKQLFAFEINLWKKYNGCHLHLSVQ